MCAETRRGTPSGSEFGASCVEFLRVHRGVLSSPLLVTTSVTGPTNATLHVARRLAGGVTSQGRGFEVSEPAVRPFL